MLSSWLLSGSYLMPADSTLTCLGWYPGGPAGSYHRNQHRMISRSPRIRVTPEKAGDMNCRSTTAPFIPWIKVSNGVNRIPLNPGLRCHVPTYPRTRPSEPAFANAGDVSIPFGKLSTGSGSLFCYRLPSHKTSRLCSCLSLIVAVL